MTFEIEPILQEARTRAGADDFGPAPFRAPLEVLLADLERSPLHAQGRAAQRERVVESLVVRLRFQEECARHPEILEEQISAPWVVVGLARTGTTRLHRLLACDPQSFAPLWWEVRAPAPPRAWDFSAGVEDPRIAEAHAAVRMILETQPVLASVHPWDAEGADEEIMLMEHAFLSHVPESSTHLPNYRRWLDAQNFAPAYAYLKQMLQFLQWQKKQRGERAQRWVLKTPMHLGYLDALCDAFPGAFIIQTHRDPLETVPSTASLYAALWGLGQSAVDFEEVGRQCLARYARALARSLEARARLGDENFLDVWFEDVGRDALGQVQRIYKARGCALDAATRAAMQNWLRENAREKRPPHVYTLEKFGLSARDIEQAFAAYRERFILQRAP